MKTWLLWILLLPAMMMGQKLLPSPFPVGAGGGGGGGGGTAVAPYFTTVTTQTSVSISAATHGQGVLAVAYCFDNSTPRIAVSCDQNYTRDSSGNLVFTFSPAFTGLIEVGSGGGVNGSGAGNFTVASPTVVGNLIFATNTLGTAGGDSGIATAGSAGNYKLGVNIIPSFAADFLTTDSDNVGRIRTTSATGYSAWRFDASTGSTAGDERGAVGYGNSGGIYPSQVFIETTNINASTQVPDFIVANTDNFSGIAHRVRFGIYGDKTSSFLNSSAVKIWTINDSGAVGMGTTPQTWTTSIAPLQVGGLGALYANNAASAGSGVALAFNNYNASGDKYIITDAASRFLQLDGDMYWQQAASGTAGAAIGYTTVAFLKNSTGNLILGNGTTDDGSGNRLQVYGGGLVVNTTLNTLIGADTSGSSGSSFATIRGRTGGTTEKWAIFAAGNSNDANLRAIAGNLNLMAGGSIAQLTLTSAGKIIATDLKTTGSATGKTVVCVDTSTGQLYASTSGVACAN